MCSILLGYGKKYTYFDIIIVVCICERFGFWFLGLFLIFLISFIVVMILVCIRREASVPDHKEEGKWTQVSCNWQEDPRGMLFFCFSFSILCIGFSLICRDLSLCCCFNDVIECVEIVGNVEFLRGIWLVLLIIIDKYKKLLRPGWFFVVN